MISERELMGEYWHNLHIKWVENWPEYGFESQDAAIECVGRSIASARKHHEILKKMRFTENKLRTKLNMELLPEIE